MPCSQGDLFVPTEEARLSRPLGELIPFGDDLFLVEDDRTWFLARVEDIILVGDRSSKALNTHLGYRLTVLRIMLAAILLIFIGSESIGSDKTGVVGREIGIVPLIGVSFLFSFRPATNPCFVISRLIPASHAQKRAAATRTRHDLRFESAALAPAYAPLPWSISALLSIRC